MSVIWTGIWPFWLVLPLGLLLVLSQVWLYRRQRVAKPWNVVLPMLRSLALILLVLALLQPVLARFSRQILRGEVLVLVDDSGSMGVADRYEPARAIRIASRLELFPAILRAVLQADEAAWNRILEPLDKEEPTENDLQRASERLERWLSDTRTRLDRHAYLRGEGPPGWTEWVAAVRQNAADAGALNALRKDFPALQEAADTALAEAGIPEVDAALEKLGDMTRLDLVTALWDRELFGMLDAKGEVKVFGLDSGEQPFPEPDLGGLTGGHATSPLGEALRDAVRGRGDAPLTGVVLISDGNINAGLTLTQFVETLEGRNLPFVALGVGEEKPAEDLVLEQVIAPETVFVKDRVAMRVLLSRHGYTDVPVELRVSHGGETLHTQILPPGEEERLWVDVGFVETETGEREYRVELEHMEDEWLERNNHRDVRVNVLEDAIRVLLVDAWPRWETRYLDMMLQRDPRVEAHTIFYGSSESGTLRTGPDRYPETREDLFGYEVVILGDVDPAQFSRGQLEDLRDFVEERGGTLIWIAGTQHMPLSFQHTLLWSLAPFRLSPAASEPGQEFPVFRLQLTDTGKHDPMSRISNADEVSRRLWEELPPLPWVKQGLTALPMADRTAETVEGEVPVLIKSHRGLGRLVYIGSDSFWRWRDRARWTYHQRLWGQIILWSVLDRTGGSDPHVKLMTDRLHYATGESVTLRARLLDANGRPLSRADASVEIYDERGEQVRKLTLRELSGEGGAYEASVDGLPEGRYTVRPVVFELRNENVQAEINFRIGDLPTNEYVRLAYDAAALRGATPHVGRVWDPETALTPLEPQTHEITRREDLELWNHPLFLALAVGLLSAEWWNRRRKHLP
ncbi:MAG: hypothetical protein JJU05_04540 [Verrucomicrobia bacterium]|nr:hypothetical protein [Verrucomicrobiota bacterium]MCH8525601.1 hypothetical protein [Kiritimatiellia bacterium]